MSAESDQKFFDLYSLILGILALVALAIFVLSKNMSASTQGYYKTEGAEYRQRLSSRLQPFGDSRLPGEEQVAAAPAIVEPVAAALSGPQVYNEACIACHAAGIGGAPMLTDSANWAPRIDQGMDTLRQHAIEGYTGAAGYMPPKGGRLDLSDDEIYGAIDFMLEQIP